MNRLICLASAAIFCGLRASALELGAPFADHAVLQCGVTLPVWGWRKPDAEVTVEFAGQEKSATAADNGKWSLALDPLEASAELRPMTLSEKGGESRTLRDLLAGEVTSKAGETDYVCAISFVHGTFKGVLFVTGPALIKGDQDSNFSPEVSALANSLITGFGGKAVFLYTMHSRELAPEITAPAGIKGEARAILIKDWNDYNGVPDAVLC